MPLYIPRGDAHYLGDAVPMLVLVSTEQIDGLPQFQLDAGKPLPCEGWQILPGVFASVVDGPGDSGIFVEGDVRPEPDKAEERFAWLESVERSGGAIVLVVDSYGAVDDLAALADGGKVRGGFVSAAQRDG